MYAEYAGYVENTGYDPIMIKQIVMCGGKNNLQHCQLYPAVTPWGAYTEQCTVCKGGKIATL